MSGIQGLSPPSYPTPPATNVPVLAKQMEQQINTLNDSLKSLLQQPSQSEDPEFLKKIQGAILALAETSKQINGE